MPADAKLSFRTVEAFVAIIEEGSLTAAAKRLGASVSAISLQLANLEKVLGAKLLERSSQRFALTPAGEVFHPRALRILDEVSAAGAAVSRTGASARMLLKLAIIEDLDRAVLPAWLTDARNHQPNIRFHVRSGPSHENHAALGNRSADIIVAVGASEASDWIEQHPIFRDPYILVTSQGLSPQASISSLLEAPFVRYGRELLMGRQIEAQLRRAGIVPAWEHEFSSSQAVFSMVEAVDGWTITTLSAFSAIVRVDEASACPDRVHISRLPIPAFSRSVSLCARKDALGDLPTRLADALRQSVDRELVAPLRHACPQIVETTGLCVIRI